MDIALKFDDAIDGFDLSLDGPDLATDEAMATAITVSLYSDARARADDALPAAGESRRGWWGDGLSDFDGDAFGSRLWLLTREKQTAETLNRHREIAAEALDWLVADGVARAVEVTADWIDWTPGDGDRVIAGGRAVRAGIIGLTVTITRPDNSEFSRRFDHVWQAIAA